VRRQPIARRWATATRWPVGIVLAAWRYAWSTTPVHRWEMSGTWVADAPPDLPASVDATDVQRPEDGVGPLLHRLYRTRVVATTMSAEDLMGRLFDDLDQVAPSEFATFQRLGGDGRLARGDDWIVRMPGPWDGPVRVIAIDATSFRLATLDGHLEAGQIEFRAAGDHRGLSFEIESWARNGDRLSNFLYTHLRLSKEVQLHMWSSVLRRVVEVAGGRMSGGIVITTRVVAPAALPSGEGHERKRGKDDERLRELAALPVNFDPAKVDEYANDPGWRIDDMVEELTGEGPGPPAPGGSWEVAARIMDGYQLADPAIVTAIFDRDSPLEGRDMLLQIHFWVLRFRVGVRVGEVYRRSAEVDGREVLIHGWSYRTLEGHFEQGQMHYELWKWLDTGAVEFRLRAVSRAARSGPLLRRIGFRLFGRANQLHFYRQICRRIRRLTEAQLEADRAAGPPSRSAASTGRAASGP
jgi:uncharacterized protein (UPF0548 family)